MIMDLVMMKITKIFLVTVNQKIVLDTLFEKDQDGE